MSPPVRRLNRPLSGQVIRTTLRVQKEHPNQKNPSNGRISLEGRIKLNEQIIRSVVSELKIAQFLLDPKLSDDNRIQQIANYSLEVNGNDRLKARQFLEKQYNLVQSANYDKRNVLERLGRLKKMSDPKEYVSETEHATMTPLAIIANQLYSAIRMIRRIR